MKCNFHFPSLSICIIYFPSFSICIILINSTFYHFFFQFLFRLFSLDISFSRDIFTFLKKNVRVSYMQNLFFIFSFKDIFWRFLLSENFRKRWLLRTGFLIWQLRVCLILVLAFCSKAALVKFKICLSEKYFCLLEKVRFHH